MSESGGELKEKKGNSGDHPRDRSNVGGLRPGPGGRLHALRSPDHQRGDAPRVPREGAPAVPVRESQEARSPRWTGRVFAGCGTNGVSPSALSPASPASTHRAIQLYEESAGAEALVIERIETYLGETVVEADRPVRLVGPSPDEAADFPGANPRGVCDGQLRVWNW